MEKNKYFGIANAVETAYEKLNNSDLSSISALTDLATPNHDGIKDTNAVADLMLLRESLNSLAKLSKLWIENITEVIGDKLELDINALGMSYHGNDDGSYDVKYDGEAYYARWDMHNVVTIREDSKSYYFDLNVGLGESIYNKKDSSFQSVFMM